MAHQVTTIAQLREATKNAMSDQPGTAGYALGVLLAHAIQTIAAYDAKEQAVDSEPNEYTDCVAVDTRHEPNSAHGPPDECSNCGCTTLLHPTGVADYANTWICDRCGNTWREE